MIWLALMSGVANAAGWSLVGAYDSSSVSTLSEAPAGYVWREAEGMKTSCGPAKRPDGLGIFEAEAANYGLMPMLTLVLKSDSPGETLTSQQVQVTLNLGDDQVSLEPMRLPRQLIVSIASDDSTERYAQLVRTQIAVETCLEHKTGRAWTGGPDGERLKEAFLLSRPGAVGRRFFGGQSDAVPALLGPPDACMVSVPESQGAEGRGEGSLTLVPTDVWGASLRRCSDVLSPGDAYDGEDSPLLPLRLTGEDQLLRRKDPRTWNSLQVALRLDPEPAATESERVFFDLSHGDHVLAQNEQLFKQRDDSTLGLSDVLARLPHRFPYVDGEGGPYTVLMIPNWQLVEALARLERDQALPADLKDVRRPMGTPPVGVTDAVGYVLGHPEMLLVQIERNPGDDRWPNVANILRGNFGPWGYTVGLREGRARIVLPHDEPPSWEQTARAQRAREHAAMIAALFLLFFGGLRGFGRLRELWARVPEERAHYWPALGSVVLSETPTAKPEDES